MACDDFRLHAHFTDQCAEAQAQGLHAHEVELFLKQPARIIFTKTRRFDEGEGLIAQRVGGERGDGLWEHEGDFRLSGLMKVQLHCFTQLLGCVKEGVIPKTATVFLLL